MAQNPKKSRGRARPRDTFKQSPPGRSQPTPPPGPNPPTATAEAVWDRIYTLLGEDEKAKPEPSSETKEPEPKTRKRGQARKRQRWQRLRRSLDVIGTITWVGLLTKLFIADWDRILLSLLFPEFTWVLDLRWFFPIALLAMLLILFKVSKLGLGLAYVVGFPLVVLFWKIPKLLLKYRSPYVFFGLLSAGTTVASRSRRFIVSFAIGCFSAFMIIFGDTDWLRIAGIIGMLGTLGWLISTTAIDMLRLPEFIRAQEKVVKTFLSWDVIDKFILPKQPSQLSLSIWKIEDAKAYRDSAGNAVIAKSALNFAAYSLERYRTGPTTVALNAIAIVALTLQVVLIFSFINYGVFLLEPLSFHTIRQPEFSTFIYYSFSALYFGEIASLVPLAGLATIAKIVNGVVGALILFTIFASIFAPYLKRNSETVSSQVVSMITGRAANIDEVSVAEYQMTLVALEERLANAAWGALGVAHWLSNRIPDTWPESDPPAPPPSSS